jgi:hypothetical protein
VFTYPMRYDLGMKYSLPLLLLLPACASREWRDTIAANTSAAYSTYAASHAGTVRGQRAERLAQQLAWEEAVAANRSVAYYSYASAWPGAEHAEEARAKAESLGWEEAAADGSVAALTAFVARFPQSSHVPDAHSRIEDLVYEEVKRQPSEASFSRYLVQYPEGRYAAEARVQHEQLSWDAAVAADTRTAYQAYVRKFPTGAHVQAAQDWLASTYVTSIQPVVAVVSTWQPDPRAVLQRVQRGVDRGLVLDLARDFKVLPTKAVDATRGMAHPHEIVGVQRDVGILVIEYTEKKGRKFDPSGNATDITAVVRLYAPNSKTPVYVRELSATTPDKIRGTEISALNSSAIDELAGQLRALDEELARQRREGT